MIEARRSEPRASGPSGRTMTSFITSPMPRMRGGAVMATRRARGDSPGFASTQQSHEIAPAAESLFEGCDIICLLGGAAQAAHAIDEACGLLISAIAAPVCEFIDAFSIDVQSLARMIGFAFAGEALLDRP